MISLTRYFRHLTGIFLLVCVALLVDISGFDLWLAKQMYHLEGGEWAWRYSYLTETVLHRGVRKALVLATVVLLLTAIASHWVQRIRHLQRWFWYLVLCFITTPLVVAIAKQLTHMDCPWDVLQLGGQYPYLHLLQAHPGTWRYGHCFPAAHASGGYALIALYFFLAAHFPRWRFAGLAFALIIGLINGFTQQLRGAHFLSHDLWTIAIAWFVSVTYLLLLFPKKQKSSTEP